MGERERGKHINLVNLTKFHECNYWSNDYFKQVPKTYHYQHGAVLQRDSEGNTFYYETCAKFVIKESTIEQIAEKLVGIYKRIEFKLYLHGDLNHRKFRKGEHKEAVDEATKLMRNNNECM